MELTFRFFFSFIISMLHASLISIHDVGISCTYVCAVRLYYTLMNTSINGLIMYDCLFRPVLYTVMLDSGMNDILSTLIFRNTYVIGSRICVSDIYIPCNTTIRYITLYYIRCGVYRGKLTQNVIWIR